MAGAVMGGGSVRTAVNVVWVAFVTASTAIGTNAVLNRTRLGPGWRAVVGGLGAGALGAGLMYVGAPATGLGVIAGGATVAGVQTKMKVEDSGYLRTVEAASARAPAPAALNAPASEGAAAAGLGTAGSAPAGGVYSMSTRTVRR